jgi:hypothetical protein
LDGNAACVLERSCDAQHTRCQQSIGAPEYGVLFVNGSRHMGTTGGDHGRHRRIAAEANDGGGLETAQQAGCLSHAQQQFDDAEAARDWAARQRRAGRNMVAFDIGQCAAKSDAAAIGDEDQATAARLKFHGDRLRREHMPAGAAGSQHDRCP